MNGHSAQPFALPALSLPTTARLSPYRDQVRRQVTDWAQEMGMLSAAVGDTASRVWTSHDLHAHDYPLMCAYVHPDADVDELTLITQWYTWVFFFDDHFLERFKKTGDRGGAVAHLDQVVAVLRGSGVPQPGADPVRAGLADLWARTAPGMSEGWKARFVKATVDLLEDSLTELDSITFRRVPDPIEYIELRRRVGGAPWSAALVEHTVGEIPPALVDTRPVRVLTDTFSDAVHLRNDLFSYQREMEQEGEPHNAVLVVQRFFDRTAQQAAQTVADLVTSRLRLFERVAAVELPELLNDVEADSDERRRIAAYVQGLRDWQSGGHEWHSRSSRYMNSASRSRPARAEPVATGPGTGLTRPVRPITGLGAAQTTVPATLPDLASVQVPVPPFPLRLSPHLERVRASTVQWARQMRLCEPDPLLPRSHVWTEQDVAEFDITLCACGVFPDGTVEELELVSGWLHMTYIDDLLPAVFGHTERAAAKQFIAELAAVLAPAGQRPAPRTTAQRLLAHLWDRSTAGQSQPQWQPMQQGLRAWLWSNLWEHDYNRTRTVPDPIDFMEMTRKTFGADFMLAMIRARHPAIPAHIYTTTPMVVLADAVCDLFRLMNEPISYSKETQTEGEVINAVIVLGRFFDLDVDTAAAAVDRLFHSRATQLQRVIAQDLPALYERHNLPGPVREEITSYADTLCNWVAGVAHWHRTTLRYNPDGVRERYRRLRRRALLGPATVSAPTPV